LSATVADQAAHLIAPLDQALDEVTADESGSSRDEDICHG
jgi:hypothetical protein